MSNPGKAMERDKTKIPAGAQQIKLLLQNSRKLLKKKMIS